MNVFSQFILIWRDVESSGFRLLRVLQRHPGGPGCEGEGHLQGLDRGEREDYRRRTLRSPTLVLPFRLRILLNSDCCEKARVH
ncbi:hypothetical protein CC2G_013590 [Coprinopsis cinerea AmutBmut pab1-1]|nr:hypothetical protein CC2G_013590 [Coprinopsis cinerea AmutBmut pab1-1]